MISVVIPLYNKAHTILGTLQSVLLQKFQNFELIIIDDGSTDKGVELIKNSIYDNRIIIYQQANKGVSVARNEGVRLSKYNYTAFLDGDDEWQPDYLLKVSEAITKYPQAGMFCCAGIVKNESTTVLRLAKKYKGQILEVDFFENPHVFVHTSATVIKKSAFFKTQGFPVGMKRNQDYACFFSIALIAPVIYIGFPLTTYIGDVQGQATQTPVNLIIDHVIDRFNIVHGNWESTIAKNETYIIFTTYELRHMYLKYILNNNYEVINSLNLGIDEKIFKHLYLFELKLYKIRKLKYLAIIFLVLTKIRWRIRGYPYIGQ